MKINKLKINERIKKNKMKRGKEESIKERRKKRVGKVTEEKDRKWEERSKEGGSK